jgi:putative colanic acid biosynthesis UDP-glucose lipid carrier transferase
VPQHSVVTQLHLRPASVRGNGSSTANLAPARDDPPISGTSITRATFRLGTVDPPSVILVKELLWPGVTVVTLIVSALASGSRFSMALLALCIISFLLAQKILGTPTLASPHTERRESWSGVSRLLLEWACIFSLFFFIVIALGLTHLLSPSALTAWLLVTPLVLILSNAAAPKLARWWALVSPTSSRHIIIGATTAGLELAKRVQQNSSSGLFLGFFDFRDRSRLSTLSPNQWAGSCAEVAEFVRTRGVDVVYIALPMSSTPRIAELLRQLRDTTASIYFIPASIFEFELVRPRCVEIHGIPALAVCDTPYSGMSGLVKRAFDLTMGVLTLAATAPVMIAIAAAVKLSSSGPVLFKQRRYGLHGEEIFIYKFRSMTVCEDGPEIVQATRNDIRTTAIGRFLRRSSLDELPQIFNVLQGTMSLIGPRPHAIAHNEMYRKLISGYMVRHKVRPGITGWAQVNGLRGQTDTLEKMRRRIDYDIAYLNNWSLRLDFKILLKTFLVLWRDEHAY